LITYNRSYIITQFTRFST